MDNTDNSFTPATINGTIGDLVLLADGSWTFTANSAFDNLNVGDSVNETFNVTSEDGTPTTVQITINGTNDAATVSSDTQTLTETDAPLVTTGTLTSTDVDNTDNSFTPATINGTIGDLVLLADGSWTFTANSAFDNLNVGDSVNETFNVTSEDGTPTTVQITINGTNDAATVSSDTQTLTETDAPLVTTGTLTSTDPDNTDNSFTPATINGTIGDLVLLADGSWTFTANSAFDNLNVGDSVNETFNVTSEDGTPTTVQITINGTNDAATVSSDSQTLTETDAPLVTTGTLTSTDPDNTDNSFTPATINGTIGDLVLLADGSWTFTANAAFDHLNVGDSVNETFNVTSEDGTPTTVQITINGTNDAATVSSDAQTLTETDAPLVTTGTLTSTDVDNTDNSFTPATTNGTIGDLVLLADGSWTFTANSAFDNLNVGDSVNETFNVTSEDGTPTTVQITINGTNDAATVSSDSQTLVETDAPLVTTGTLTSTDVDNTDNSFTPATINGTIGDLVLLADGSWTFTANSAFDNLNVGDSVNETFNVTSEDGTPTTVQITINGTNDAATVSSDAQTLTETDAQLITTGTLTSTDVDNTDNSFTPATINGTIGDLVLLADGSWTFTANSAFDNLNVGDSVNETFNVTSEDGTPTTVQITINGTNDAATVSSDSQTLVETDAPLITTGTLTSTDVDNADNSFTPATITGTIGDLVLLADGSWTFTANSAFDNLNVGDSVNETFNVTSEDGTPTTVQITINGTNDAATVSSDSQTLTETDAPLVTTGTLTSTDVDNADNSFTPANITGTIGDLVLLADGSWTFTANSAFDNLNVGDSVNETFNVTSEDGTPTTVQITINGTNDAATVSSDAQTLVETDAPLVTTGTLTSTDVDNTDNSFTPATINGTIGDLVLLADGSWTFTANSAFDNLNVGDSVNETFNVTSEDGTPTTVQITINGTNDAATVSSDAQTLTETDAPLVTTGTLTSTDPDNTDNSFTPATINGTIGDLVLLADGSWTFTANSAFDNLNVGDSVNETFNVTSEDGTPTTVQITINGTNDAATVSSDSQTLTETDAPLVTTGTLTSTDVDNTDNSFIPATINGTIGDLVLLADGSWTFTANSAFDNLNVGDSVNETFNVTSEDGTPTTVQITINGTNDAATVSSDSQTLTETDAPLVTTGTLTSTDPDNTDNSFTPATINGTIGDLVLLADGSWTFTANSAFDNLNVGDSVNETFNVTSEDGTPTTVQITINGTNDAATVSSDSQTLTETDAPLITTGTLTSTDVDNTDNSFTPANITGTIGDLVLLADGSWTFTANSAFDNLNVGDSVNETFNVTSEDGTPTTVQITINGSNDGPVIDLDASGAGTGYTTNFTEGGSAISISDVDISITDIDDTNIESAQITLTNAESGDLLNVGMLPPGITASAYNPATGILTLTGTGSLADYQSAINAIQFQNTSGSGSSTARVVEVVVNDGTDNSSVATTTINVTTIPTVSIDDVLVQEPASGTTTLTFTVSIDETLASDLTFDYQTVDISALGGSDYQVIGLTQGTITAGSTSTTITVTVNSDANNFEGDETFSVDLSNFNQTVNFTAIAHTTTDGIQGIGTIGANNGPPVAVDDSYVTNTDTNLLITNLLDNDSLVDGAIITGFTQGANGSVTDNGDGTFTYSPVGGYSGTDTFTYTLTDADGETDTATVTVTVSSVATNPPVVVNVPDITYTENDAATSLLSGVSISDSDSSNLSSVVVRIDGYIPSQDVLAYLTAGTSVTASESFTGTSWELTLSGGTDINEYLIVLGSLTYENNSENPSSAARSITVEAYDDLYNNLFGTDAGVISVVPVNDAPDVFDNNVFVVNSSNDNALNINVPTDADTDDSLLVITVTGLPSSVGTLTYADGSPVLIGDTLTLAELSSLEFDAGATDGAATFTYDVFDGALTTSATTTINVGATESDTGTVHESALSNGTGGGSNTVSGNLFANDAASTPTSSIDDVNGTTPVGGVITVTTAIGTLTVYADNSTPGFSAGDYVYVLDSADPSSNDVDEVFTYNFTESAVNLSDTLTITVVDDAPIANDLMEEVPESEEQIFNLMLTLDTSGSMNWSLTDNNPPPVGEPSRLDIAKDALLALAAEYFNQSSLVDVTLLSFADNPTVVGTYSDFTSFETAVNGLTAGGGTDYVDALNQIETEFTADIATQNPVDDVQNISYFISDGVSQSSPVGGGFDSYVNSNSIDSYAVGIGPGLAGGSADLDFIHNVDALAEGFGQADGAIVVEDINELESELLNTVPTAFGGNITVNGSVQNIAFGADDGFVQQIIMDIGGTNYTFSYDGANISITPALANVQIDGSTVTLDPAVAGFTLGTFSFDFSDGSYTFSSPNGNAGNQLVFNYTVEDGDGDTASGVATIDIVDDSPTANNDLDSVARFEVAEGNVINAQGTDGGPTFGNNFTPFATQGSGVDKIVDDATITEFTFRGAVIDFNVTVTSNPPPNGGSENNVEVDNNWNPANSNFTITGLSGGAPAAVNFYNNGVGVQGGGSNTRLNAGESLVVTFDAAELPYGVDNLTLTMTDFGGGDSVTITVFDTAGGVLTTFTQTSTDAIDLTAFSGIGSVQLDHAGGFDSALRFVDYDPTPEPPGTVVPAGGNDGGTISWTYAADTDIDGNTVVRATVTDTSDNAQLIFNNAGYYQFTPDQSDAPVNQPVGPVTNVNLTSQANVDASDLTVSIVTGGATLEYNGNGVGVLGGNGNLLSQGEEIQVVFDAVANPLGVNNLILTITDFQLVNTDQVTVVITHDTDGDGILSTDTVSLTAVDNGGTATFDLSDFAGVTEFNIGYTGTGFDSGLQTVSYQTLLSLPPATNETPEVIEYTLTDSDGQTDSAQLSIYAINNTITGTTGSDSIVGGNMNDAIVGDAGDDILSGGDGHDTLSGGAGDDTLSGNAGIDNLSGGAGSDNLFGGDGSDVLEGGDDADMLDGGIGDDILVAGSGDDAAFGGAGDDSIEGGQGLDTLYGGAGSDILFGGEDEDDLFGGLGDDILTGGDHADTFTWQLIDSGAVDTITDFEVGADGDVLDLSDLLQGEDTGSLSDYLHFSSDGNGGTVIDIDTDGGAPFSSTQQITLQNVDLTAGGTLTDQDIINNLLAGGNLITD